MSRIVNVLIVDDSPTFRTAVEGALQDEPFIRVVGSVRNGEKAMEFIKASPPDMVTLDVEMPEMDGIQTLQAVQSFNASNSSRPPVGVIMLSAFTKRGCDITVQALQAGAFDFIAKPAGENHEENMRTLKRQLSTKINVWASVKRLSEVEGKAAGKNPVLSVPLKVDFRPASHSPSAGFEAICIGVSTGGPKALSEMLPSLCRKSELPIFIVQHMPPTFTKSLADQLQAKCAPYKVVEAEEGELVNPKTVYIAPGGKHMLVKKLLTKIRISLNEHDLENGCRPSADVLFRSLVSVYGGNTLAIILTGMGCDGTKGVAPLKRAGAYVIAQDEASSVVWGMPGSAISAGHVDEVKPLNEIPDAVCSAMLARNGVQE